MTAVPLVSVIVPTWNRAHLVLEAVRSALAQTFAGLEVLVCDDGSTDNTRDVVSSLDDGRVTWLAGAHAGLPAAARNRGIARSRGEWLAFLDSDDTWDPGKLEWQVAVARRSHRLASCTNARRLRPVTGSDDRVLRPTTGPFTFRTLLHGNPVICSSVLVHSSAVARADGFPENPLLRVGEDHALWLRVATLTEFDYLDEPLVTYRDDGAASIRGTDTRDAWTQQRDALSDFLGWASSRRDEVATPLLRAARWRHRYVSWRAAVHRWRVPR